ncbi:PadR family transcriptional regulator [Clostridiisalibacter paucivorans]|uniref:PadR family transcriptional regulator n=1 Tax=Clostridiisalibacter paucivorans TaxID=408753 RepID=UPI00047B60FF|nr:helix-turn-helix transcriptional regulator [Clostridiisalibacter paucivorans]
MKINKELIKGSTELLVLSLLRDDSMYGYQMIKELEQRSEGTFSFKEGTLYPILHNLENKGMVKSRWDKGNGNRKRKYYELTKKGKKSMNEKKEEWRVFKCAVDKMVWRDSSGLDEI